MPCTPEYARFRRFAVATLLALPVWFLASMPALAAKPLSANWLYKVAPVVLQNTARAPEDFVVVLEEQADLSGSAWLYTKEEKGQYVYDRLREVATRTQSQLRRLLDEQQVEYRSFWVANMLRVRGDWSLLQQIARRPEVARIEVDSRFDIAPLLSPEPTLPPQASMSVEWNVARVGAVQVWNAGVTGQGAVVGSMDTGFQWDHPALIQQYRGFDRGIADHNYNWHDAIQADRGPCGPQSLEPCDADGHGTLTMGTTVGDDGGANQIGVAPGAKWIGCRCWEPIRRTHLTYVSECFEFFLAPTDQDGRNADPAQAPHVINNSWICEFDEGCTDPLALLQIVENVRAAGIVVVASAGNSGERGCSSISDPPAIYDAAFTVGSTDNRDSISSFSSLGPVSRDGSNRLKPDIVAPGENVRSSDLGGRYTSGVSGTSLAGPVVAGTVALLIAAVPSLAGDVDALEQIMIDSAWPLEALGSCGDVSNESQPNNTFGWGRVDAWAAYQLALARQTSIEEDHAEDLTRQTPVRGYRLHQNQPNPFNPSTQIVYEVPRRSRVALAVYDVSGKSVRALVSLSVRDAGRFAVQWDGRDNEGRTLSSGVYFARLETDGRVLASRRMTLVR